MKKLIIIFALFIGMSSAFAGHIDVKKDQKRADRLAKTELRIEKKAEKRQARQTREREKINHVSTPEEKAHNNRNEAVLVGGSFVGAGLLFVAPPVGVAILGWTLIVGTNQ